MALNKVGLKAAIKSLLTDMESKHTDSKEEFAERLANAIDAFVRSGTVKTVVAPGITVATSGTAVAQSGATTGPGEGTGNII